VIHVEKNGILKVVALLLGIALLASTYGWWECRNNERTFLVAVYANGLKDARELSDAGGTLEYLLKENASDDLILTYAYAYAAMSEHLEDAFETLYSFTKDERFHQAFSAMSTIHLFFHTLSFSNPTERRAIIEDNLETLKELDGLFKELATYQYPDDLPEELVQRLFKKSEELRVP
jgi:hypothetical protein